MKKRTSALTVIFLFLASAMFGAPHFYEATAQSSTTAVSSVTDGFQLSISVEKTQYALGEEVPITFTITNVSNQTIDFLNQNGDSNFNFQVYNSTNFEFFSWQFGAYPLTNFNVTLAPNENYTRILVWTQQTLYPEFPEIPSGSYYIVGDIAAFPLQTVPLNIIIGGAKGDSANLSIVDSTPFAFTTSTQFQIPPTNSTISFAQDGYYLNATLLNDTWVFENLQLNQPNEGALADSPNTANLNITTDTNITITSFERLLTPDGGDINNTGSWLTAGWLNYTVAGIGQQLISLQFNLANWTSPSPSNFANGSISYWPIIVHVYIDGNETTWGNGNGILPYSTGDNATIPYGTGAIVNGATSNVSIEYSWAPVPSIQPSSSSSQTTSPATPSRSPLFSNPFLIVIEALVVVIIVAAILVLVLKKRTKNI